MKHPTPILYDMHIHTLFCRHAVGEIEEYAAVAEQRGLKGLVITCHNPTINGWTPNVRMAPEDFPLYVDRVAQVRQVWAGRVDIRLGIESDYVPGMEKAIEAFHNSAEFHHVLGSVHPHLGPYRQQYLQGDHRSGVETYFGHVAMAAESGLFDTIAHMDLIKVVDPEAWSVERAMDCICRCLDRIAATGTSVELNTSGLLKIPSELTPSRPVLEAMQHRGIPVVVGSDAHEPKRVGATFEDALDLLTDVGYTHSHIVLNRKRHAISIREARESLTCSDEPPPNQAGTVDKCKGYRPKKT